MNWNLKYRPNSLKEVVNQEEAIEKLKDFVLNFKEQDKNAIILYGPAGSGKTASVYALAEQYDLELVEMNASDKRTKSVVKEIVGKAANFGSIYGKKKVILVDEADGISGRADRGGLAELKRAIKDSKAPMILTANDLYRSGFKKVRQVCEKAEFGELGIRDTMRRLKYICKQEAVKYESKVLREIAHQAQGDLRAAINNLELIAQNKDKIEMKDLSVIGYREERQNIFSSLGRIFKKKDPIRALKAFDNIDKDLDECMLWVSENVVREYENPEELAKAYNYLSRADIFKGRIRRWQHWRFLVYQNALMTAGVSLAKEKEHGGWTRYQSPTKIKKLRKTKWDRYRRDELASRLSDVLHTSPPIIKHEYLPFLRILKEHNKETYKKIKEELEISKSDEKVM